MQGWVDLVGLVTYRDGIPARIQSPIPALTGLNVEQLCSCAERCCRYAKPPTRKVLPIWINSTFLVLPIWIYWSKRQWVAVASAGPCANLPLAYTVEITTPVPHHSVFLEAGCLSDAQSTVSKHWHNLTNFCISDNCYKWNVHCANSAFFTLDCLKQSLYWQVTCVLLWHVCTSQLFVMVPY